MAEQSVEARCAEVRFLADKLPASVAVTRLTVNQVSLVRVQGWERTESSWLLEHGLYPGRERSDSSSVYGVVVQW